MKRTLAVATLLLAAASAAGTVASLAMLAARLRLSRVVMVVAVAASVGVASLVPASSAHAAPGPACTSASGQALIDSGQYGRAVQEFGCVIKKQPNALDGYRGRAEAEVLLGRYAAALTTLNRVTTTVLPAQPNAVAALFASYDARLAADPANVPALTGKSFAFWWQYDYPHTLQVLDRLLAVRPNDPYAILFRGSSRLLQNGHAAGVPDLEQGIALDPTSADVRWVVADAFTYGRVDLDRAFVEASLALAWGLDTPRVHAILATVSNARGETLEAAKHIKRAIDLVTDEVVVTAPLAAGETRGLDLVPGRVFEVPLPVSAGETISIVTSSKDMWDSIAVLLDPQGKPVLGSDDDNAYFAAFDWQAPKTATYRLRVTSFEAISTGVLKIERD